MTYHILHITTPNCYLYAEKGLLFCRFDDESENKMPIDDIRAIIVVTHQVGFSNSCLAKLMEKDVVILHCNNKYKPIGWSAGFDRVVRTKAFYNQIKQNEDFENQLWKIILKQKVLNQAYNLELLSADSSNLLRLINKPLMNEANIAKQYWALYFETLENPQKREHQNAESYENICLNYGYAVFQTLIYRSVLVHGLLPNLGIHHEEKYNSNPLIYDLVEPFRAFVDFYLYKFKQSFGGDFKRHDLKAWNKYLAFCIKNYRLKINGTSYKIIDYVDLYIEEIVNSFINFNTKDVILPNIKEQYLHIDKHRNREYEEGVNSIRNIASCGGYYEE